MSYFRQATRKPGKQLQQIFRRHQEKLNFRKVTKVKRKQKLRRPHRNGPKPAPYVNCLEYQKIQGKYFMLSIDQSDNCCISQMGEIFIVCNILSQNGTVELVVQKFEFCGDFYDVGICSTFVGIFKCHSLNSQLYTVPFESIRAKCFRMPYWPVRYPDSYANGVLPLNVGNDFSSDDDDDGVFCESPLEGHFVICEMF